MTRSAEGVTEVAEGIHRIEHAHTNVYLVQTDEGVVLVDTGLPGAWRHIRAVIDSKALGARSVAAVILTHGHFDHVGNAARAHRRWGAPILVHRDDMRLSAHPYRYDHEASRFGPPLRHPASWPLLATMAVGGAFTVQGVPETAMSAVDSEPGLPGGARVVPTPGHTHGHVALHFPDRDTVISGDALVTLDPYTGRRGPQIVAPSATADSAQALASLPGLAETGAATVLPGHGEPWTGGVAAAVDEAMSVSRAR